MKRTIASHRSLRLLLPVVLVAAAVFLAPDLGRAQSRDNVSAEKAREKEKDTERRAAAEERARAAAKNAEQDRKDQQGKADSINRLEVRAEAERLKKASVESKSQQQVSEKDLGQLKAPDVGTKKGSSDSTQIRGKSPGGKGP